MAALLRRALPRASPLLRTQIRSSQTSRTSLQKTLSKSPIRSFHATSPRKLDVLGLESLTTVTSTYLTTLHHFMPWYLVLPLSALSVRALLLPLTAWARRMNVKRISLSPLLNAWRAAIQRNTRRAGSSEKYAPQEIQKTELKLVRRKRKEVYERACVQMWKNWVPVPVQLTAFIVMIESIRGLVGAQQGVWGRIFGGGEETLSTDTVATIPKVIVDAGDKIETALVGDITSKIPLDPTLATEGMLWFTDLTASDPQLILPFLLSGVMFANLLPKHVLLFQPAPPPTEKTFAGKFLERLLKVGALAIGPLTLGLPSGLLLYWVSSSTLTLLSNLGMEYWYPAPKVPKPCMPPTMSLMMAHKQSKFEAGTSMADAKKALGMSAAEDAADKVGLQKARAVPTAQRDQLQARLRASRGMSGFGGR